MKDIYDIKEFGIVPPPYGGCSVYVKRLIDKLSSDGYRVGGFYTESCNDENMRYSSLYDRWIWMETHLLPCKIWKYLKIVKPYSIIHSHFSLEGMSYLWMIKKLGRKRIVITIHNSMIKSYYRRMNVINRFFLKRMLHSKDVCWITVSEEGKRQLLSLPIKIESHIHVIPAYIPIVDESYPPLTKDMQCYINTHKNNIAFYGHSFMQNAGSDVYGFKTIIDVYSMLIKQGYNNVGLVLCLSDVSDIDKIQELRNYAKKSNVDNYIFWQIGAINNVRTLWKNVDVYVRPTSTDGDSVAIREAIDEGCSVVASDVCKRPKHANVYKFGDNNDLCSKLISCLIKSRKQPNPNFEFYLRMKEIYNDLLKK